jgi:protein gp37
MGIWADTADNLIEDVRATETHGVRPRAFTDVECHADRLALPLRWQKPRTVFVNSMSDLLHENVPDEFILNVFTVMAVARQHTFIVLTKRPERMRTLLASWRADDTYTYWHGYSGQPAEIDAWPLPNVWLGVSVEDQASAPRIWELLKTPAAVRFASLEPLIGPVDLNAIEALCQTWRRGLTIGTYLDWIIVGGESGASARPCDVAWIRTLVQQAKAVGVPCFVKQASGPKPGLRGLIPDDLWIKEFPNGNA